MTRVRKEEIPNGPPPDMSGGPVRPVLRRLLPTLVGLLLLLILGAGALLWQQYRANMHQRIAAANQEVAGDFQAALAHQAAGLATALQAVAADPRVHRALTAGDRAGLMADWRPVYANLAGRHQLTHFYFLDRDRVCLLRVHLPERHGDRIDRFTAREAERTGLPAWGLELGPLGTLTLRVVQPVRLDGRLLGYVELGKEIEDVLGQLHTRSGHHVAVAIHKRYLTRPNWESGMRLLGRQADWDRLPESVVAYASHDRMSDALVPLARHDTRGGRDFADEVREFVLDSTVWRASITPLHDAANQSIGDLLVLSDLGEETRAFRYTMVWGGLFSTGLLILLLGVVVLLLRRTDAGILGQQAALRASRERLDYALQGANDGLWDWNLETDEVYYSPRWLEMLGYRPGELPGSLDTWAMLVHPDDKAAALACVADYLDGRVDRFEVEFRMRHKDGHWLDILSRARLARDPSGQPLAPRRLVGTHVDLSERKRVQLALERQVAFTSALIEAEIDGIAVCRHDESAAGLRFTVWNRAMTDLTGFTLAEAVASEAVAGLLRDPDDPARLGRRLAEAFEGAHLLGEECRLMHRDGEIRRVRLHTTFVTDREGNRQLLVVAQDITRLHAALEELASREASWRGLFNNADEAIYILEADGRFIDVNPAAVSMYGHDRAWFVGKTPADVSAPGRNDLELLRQNLARVMAGQPQRFEFWGRRADGGAFPKEVYVAPSEYFGRTVMIAMARDISERLDAQERIARSEAALRAERDLFVGGPVGVLVWRTEPDWPLEYASANIRNVFGHTAERMLAPDFRYAECVHPDDLPRVAAEVAAYLADPGRRTWEQHYRILWPDGSVHRLYDFTVAERDADGRAIRLRGYVTDETLQYETAQRLALVRQQLEFAIQGSGVGLWDWRVRTGEVVFNERWAEMLGYDLAELTPTGIDTWRRVAHPDDLAASEAALTAHFRGETDRYVCEARMRHRSGEWIWVLDQGKVVEWSGDDPATRQPLRMVGTHTDITRLKRLEAELRHERGFLRTLVRTIPDLIWLKDATGIYLGCNARFERYFGIAEADLVGRCDEDFVGREQADRFRADDRLALVGGTPVVREAWVTFADDGHRELLEITKTPMLDEQGQPTGVLGIGHDITERKRAEEDLRLAAGVFSHAREGIMITSPDATIIDVNAAFTAITGYARDEIVGQTPRALSSGLQGVAFYAELWSSLLEKGHWHGEIWNRRKSGEVYPEMLTISGIRDEDGRILRYVAMFSDITPFKEYQHQLEHIAHYDALTGLPNRILLADRLHQAMAQSQRRGTALAVAYLDLDGFKAINDGHGHDIGDRLLTTVSARMKQALREVDTIARLGGDEFVAVLLDLADHQACVPMLDRLLAAAAEPVRLDSLELRVSASLGVAFFPQAEEIDADQLLRQADQAMYQAKLAGKNRYHLFDAVQDRNARGHHESIEHIRHALVARQFVLHYQPKVNMHTGAVIGAEALIRWQHPERGLLPPAAFLPAVAEHPLIVELGEWVLDTALAQIEAWRRAGLELPVSVNVDAMQLQSPLFVERLRGLLEAHPGVSPGQLELEILETSALEDIGHVSAVMLACHAIGVDFALDDFGTGYSSLTYLKRLPATLLKIDQSFVRDMLDDPEDLAILEGVLGLAGAFRRRVIAEGVETQAHGEMLLRLGCELGQGYAIARPMPADEIPGWLAVWCPPPDWVAQGPSGQDDLPILFGMAEHRAWVAAVSGYLLDERGGAPPLDVHQCRFGQWLDREGQARFGHRADFDMVLLLHREIHERAGELIALKQDGRHDEARERADELGRLRDTLVDRLLRLLA